MRHAKLTSLVLSLALGAALALPAAAAGEAPPVSGEGGSAPSEPAYQVSRPQESLPIPVWGTVSALREDRLLLTCDSEDAPYSQIVVRVTESTPVLDAVSGEARSLAALQEGEVVYAWVGPAMTRSLPPIANAALLLCGIPEDFHTPAYAEVENVFRSGDQLSVYMSNHIVLHLDADTKLLAAPGQEAPSLEDIVPGARLLSWYTFAALSNPPQSSPSQVVVFPSQYDGYVSVPGLGMDVHLNGAPLELPEKAPAKVEDGHLMLPVRAVAEALGCQVGWDNDANAAVVSRDGAELYRLVPGQDTAVWNGSGAALLTAPQVTDGVTYLSLEDLVLLHGLKLESPCFL